MTHRDHDSNTPVRDALAMLWLNSWQDWVAAFLFFTVFGVLFWMWMA